MRKIAALPLAACLVLAACGGDGRDERFPSLGIIPKDPAPLATAPAFPRPMGETNITYGDVVMDGVCNGLVKVHNSLDQPVGIEVEVEFYREGATIAKRRYAWWPSTPGKGAALPTEGLIQPGESYMMELTNDAIEGYNGPFSPGIPTGCQVTAAHIQPNPQPRPCTEKHGPQCTATGKAWIRD